MDAIYLGLMLLLAALLLALVGGCKRLIQRTNYKSVRKVDNDANLSRVIP